MQQRWSTRSWDMYLHWKRVQLRHHAQHRHHAQTITVRDRPWNTCQNHFLDFLTDDTIITLYFFLFDMSRRKTTPTKWCVRLAKTQISLHIAQSDLSLCGALQGLLRTEDTVSMIYIITGNTLFCRFCPVQAHKNYWAAAWQNQQTDICAYRRLRSAWASAQSDQTGLCCALNG